MGAENRSEYQWSLLIPMSGLGLVILQPRQFLDQNPLNPLNPVNIFVFDGTTTKPIWPMSSINFYKMNLLSTSHSPQVNLADYRNLMTCLWHNKNETTHLPIIDRFTNLKCCKMCFKFQSFQMKKKGLECLFKVKSNK